MPEDCPEPERECPFDKEVHGKMLQILIDMKEDIKEIRTDNKKIFDGIFVRLGNLEIWRGYILGAIAVVGFVLSIGVWKLIGGGP